MDGVTPNEGKIPQLTQLLAATVWSNAKIGLSEADITPDADTVAADLTVDEVSVSGYSRQSLTGWSTPAIDGSDRAVSEADDVTFLNTSGGDSGIIYTWFFIDNTFGTLLEAGRFSTPFVLIASTGSYTTTPFVRLGSE